jgi:hypothetical protein
VLEALLELLGRREFRMAAAFVALAVLIRVALYYVAKAL